MNEQTLLQRYLAYLRAVPDAFASLEAPGGGFGQPGDVPIGGVTGVQALVRAFQAIDESNRLARERAGLSQTEVEHAEAVVDWLRQNAGALDDARARAQVPFGAKATSSS